MAEASKKLKDAENIYMILSSQRFADWYSDNGEFGQHIMGMPESATIDEIIIKIAKMFKLGDV